MMNLNCATVLTLIQVFKIISDISLKKHKTLTTIPPIYVCINGINNTLVFKVKDGYNLELQTPETMKLFDNTKKKLIEKQKMGKMYQLLKWLK